MVYYRMELSLIDQRESREICRKFERQTLTQAICTVVIIVLRKMKLKKRREVKSVLRRTTGEEVERETTEVTYQSQTVVQTQTGQRV